MAKKRKVGARKKSDSLYASVLSGAFELGSSSEFEIFTLAISKSKVSSSVNSRFAVQTQLTICFAEILTGRH